MKKKKQSSCGRQKNVSSKKEIEKARIVNRIIKGYIVFCVALWLLGEFTLVRHFTEFLYKMFWVEASLAVLASIVSIWMDYVKGMELREENVHVVLDMLRVFKTLVSVALRCTLAQLMLVLLFTVSVPPAFAHYHLAGRIGAFINVSLSLDEAKDAFLRYKGEEIVPQAMVVSPPDETEDVPLPEEAPSDEQLQWFEEKDENIKELVSHMVIEDGDLGPDQILSEEDRAAIFFQNGLYVIGDWDDSEAVLKAVQQMLDDCEAEHLENAFDDEIAGAPQLLKTKVSQASEQDKWVSSFSQKRDIMNIREDAYSQYPKFTLAQLLAEDFNGCALACYWQVGNTDAAMYYYGKSILWIRKALSFDEVFGSRRMRLIESMRQRYEDIAFILPEGSMDREFAKRISEALETVKNWY